VFFYTVALGVMVKLTSFSFWLPLSILFESCENTCGVFLLLFEQMETKLRPLHQQIRQLGFLYKQEMIKQKKLKIFLQSMGVRCKNISEFSFICCLTCFVAGCYIFCWCCDQNGLSFSGFGNAIKFGAICLNFVK